MHRDRDLGLETSRLRLRPVAADDLAAFHALCTEPAVRRFLFDDRSISLDDARGLIEASAESFAQSGWGLWLIHAKDPQARVAAAGFAGLLRSDDGPPALVYALHPALQRAGHASEVSRLVLGFVFRLPGVPRVVASVDEPNLASVRVLEKLGMRRTRREAGATNALLHYELERPSS